MLSTKFNPVREKEEEEAILIPLENEEFHVNFKLN